MKEWNAGVRIRRWCLLGIFWWVASQYSFGQCPIPETVSVKISSSSAFDQNQGEIAFLFNSPIDSKQNGYRVRLYDISTERYVYDDHSPSFLNRVPAPRVSGKEILFTQLPAGRYELELHGETCHHQRYQAHNRD